MLLNWNPNPESESGIRIRNPNPESESGIRNPNPENPNPENPNPQCKKYARESGIRIPRFFGQIAIPEINTIFTSR